jgi:hypothetical protein
MNTQNTAYLWTYPAVIYLNLKGIEITFFMLVLKQDFSLISESSLFDLNVVDTK